MAKSPHQYVQLEDEKPKEAQNWLQKDGDHITGIEQKLEASNGSSLPVRHLVVRRKQRIKDDGPLAMICEFAVEHQIGLSVNLLALLGLTHLLFPKARLQTRKFVELSYYNPDTGNYTAGWDDACMVFFWIVTFTALRATVMDYLLMPLAQIGGVVKKKEIIRFAEQGWLGIYYTISFVVGMHVMYNSDYWLNLRNLWTNWPTRDITPSTKWYILVQYAFWLQQILVINIEKRRKDHWQMFTHHIVTCILLFTSYGYHQTKVANVILVLMDFVDIFLPIAKCLKYAGFTTICDVMFGIFMSTWFIARHVLYLMVCYSVWAHLPEETNYGCYAGAQGSVRGPFPPPDRYKHLIEPFMDPKGVVCFNHSIKWGFLSCLLFLQCITIMWFAMIVRVAIKVLKGGAAEEVRSEDESEEDYEEVEPMHFERLHNHQHVAMKPLEEEVGVESLHFKGRMRTNNGQAKGLKKSMSSSSGVTLPGHSDRKELLGRIGCERGT